MIRRSVVLLILAATLAGCSSFKDAFRGYGQRADVADANMIEAGRRGAPLPSDAATYVMRAAAGDQFEIQTSQLALSRSRNPEVQRVAQMMIDAHATTSAVIAGAAGQAGLTPPAPALDIEQARLLASLGQAPNGVMFDRLYLRQQLSAHQQAVNLHNFYAHSGDTAALRAAARTVLPTVRRHLGEMQRLQSVPLA